jgi:hypothetical protein
MKLAAPFVLTCALAGVASPGFTQTVLLDTIKTHDPQSGPLAISVSGARPAMPVDRLIAQAELVVQAVITGSASELSRDQSAIVSTHRATVFRTFRRSHALDGETIPSTIPVQTFGGRMTILGQDVTESDTALPPFRPGDELVLFLERLEGSTGRFAIVGANFGVFRVEDGRLQAMGAQEAVTQAEFVGKSPDVLSSYIEGRNSSDRGPLCPLCPLW